MSQYVLSATTVWVFVLPHRESFQWNILFLVVLWKIKSPCPFPESLQICSKSSAPILFLLIGSDQGQPPNNIPVEYPISYHQSLWVSTNPIPQKVDKLLMFPETITEAVHHNPFLWTLPRVFIVIRTKK